MGKIFTARDDSINNFFISKRDDIFHIPDFQRHFVWSKEEFNDLLQSLVQEDNEYFIGTIVYAPSKDESGIDIIDGQQRLVTLLITLAALRNMISDESSKIDRENNRSLFESIDEANSLIQQWLYVRKDGAKILRVDFDDDNTNKYFQALAFEYNTQAQMSSLNAFVGIEEHLSKSDEIVSKKISGKLLISYGEIRNIVESLSTSTKDLCEFVRKIGMLQIIDFRCDDYDLVHTLFEGLNSKGIKLTTAEQLKNLLFGYATKQYPESFKSIKEKWLDIEYTFESSEGQSKDIFDKFLRHYWVATYKQIYKNALYSEFKKKLHQFNDASELIELLADLSDAASFYMSIRLQSLKNDSHLYLRTVDTQLVERFNEFGVLNNEQIYIVILYFRKLLKGYPKQIQTSFYKKWLDSLWKVSFRLKYVSVSPSDFEKEIFKYIRSIGAKLKEPDIDIGSAVESSTKNFVKNQTWPLVSNRDQFIEEINQKLVYSNSTVKLLTKVFTDVFNSEKPTIAVNKPEIEHILPQSPRKWGFDKTDIKNIVNNLGNLTLLSGKDNRDVNNESFEVKLKNYERSDFKLNKEIAKYINFTSRDLSKIDNAISQRGSDLASIIETVYRV